MQFKIFFCEMLKVRIFNTYFSSDLSNKFSTVFLLLLLSYHSNLIQYLLPASFYHFIRYFPFSGAVPAFPAEVSALNTATSSMLILQNQTHLSEGLCEGPQRQQIKSARQAELYHILKIFPHMF